MRSIGKEGSDNKSVSFMVVLHIYIIMRYVCYSQFYHVSYYFSLDRPSSYLLYNINIYCKFVCWYHFFHLIPRDLINIIHIVCIMKGEKGGGGDVDWCHIFFVLHSHLSLPAMVCRSPWRGCTRHGGGKAERQ